MTRPPRRIAVLESKAAAHGGYYLAYLAERWRPREEGQELVFVLPPTFAERHPETFAALAAAEGSARGLRVEVVPRGEWEAAGRPPRPLRPFLRLPGLAGHLALRRVYGARWLLLRRRLAELRPERALVMSLDDMLLPAVLAPPPAGIDATGIWFAPSFHYGRLPADERTAGERLRARLEAELAVRFARRRGNRVLSLDPFAVAALAPRLGDRIAALPEPVRAFHPAADDVRRLGERLGVDPARTCFLLLGALGRRRGLAEALAALDHLGRDQASRACLLLAGTLASRDRAAALAAIERLRAASACQVVLAEGVIPEAELMLYFHLADVVLVTHRRHVGSSGNLLHAAAAGRPVIATRSGLIGEQTRTQGLGLTVDSASPREIAGALGRALAAPPAALFDAAAARRFAQRNTPERYAEALLAALTAPSAAGASRQ